MRPVLVLGLVLIGAAVGLAGCSRGPDLLNVSYDPTRELWKELNEQFASHHEQETGKRLNIKVGHGGSGAQARAVIDGLDADVVTLALWSDTDAIRQKGLIAEGWDKRLPNNSLPYLSTIVFVVREGNPKGIKDWPDLIKEGVKIVTPNPQTSGNGQLSFLAAWASVLQRGGTEAEAQEFVTRLYQQVPVLDTGARASTTTFAQRNIGDVHLTWENEAHLELKESKTPLQIVYPQVSIRAEPPVAVVDRNVDRKGTRATAEAYLKFLYTPEAQETIARHFYRPTDPAVLKKHAETFPAIELVPITRIAPGWEEARQRFFAAGGVYDQIQRK
jgi:sulfate transport system substrate-binding protein